MIEELLAQMNLGMATLYLLGVFFLACLIRKALVSREISKLGYRAPKVRFRLPYGRLSQRVKELRDDASMADR